MNKGVGAIREITERLEELDRLIRRLDPADRSALVALLAPHRGAATPGGAAAGRGPARPPLPPPGGPADIRAFTPARPLTPGDNVILCAAMLLSEEGASGLTAAGVRERAGAMGLRVPRDPLRTFRLAREGGRPLFRFEGSRWRLTAAGAAHILKRFGVRLAPAGHGRAGKQAGLRRR